MWAGDAFSLFSVSFLRERRKKKNALCVCVCCSVNNFLRPTIVTLYLPPFPSSLFKPRHFKKNILLPSFISLIFMWETATQNHLFYWLRVRLITALLLPPFSQVTFSRDEEKSMKIIIQMIFSLYFFASVYGNQTHLAPIQKLEPGRVYSGGRLCFEILHQLGGYTRVIKAWYPRWQWGRGRKRELCKNSDLFPRQ